LYKKRKKMSDRIVLRRVYALDPDTGGFITAGNGLVTDGRGGTTWSGVLDSLSTFGGPMVSFLPSTLSSFSTISYINTSTIGYISTTYLASLCSLGSIIDSKTTNIITQELVNTLGDKGYISTLSLQSTMTGLGSLSYISSSGLQSTVTGLGSLKYVSSSWLESSITGLGSLGYMSTITAPVSFQSTVAGLGSSGYVSTLTLQNVIDTLGSTSSYVSTPSLQSTVIGLGSSRYVSSSALQSTVTGLGSIGYVSSLALNIRYDNAGNVVIIGGSNTNIFTNVGTIYYVSTFYQSSMTYSGPQPGVELRGNVINNTNMEFSTATIRLDALSSFTNSNSRITIEAYPTLLFSKLGTGSAIQTPLCFPISTMLKYGNNILLYNTTTTNYLFAANGKSIVADPASQNGIRFIDSSNAFQQPIRISVPQNTVLNYDNNYSLYHYMPGAINFGANQTALHSNTFTPYYGSTGSIFVSIQNSV
jgi:hypothetical protein